MPISTRICKVPAWMPKAWILGQIAEVDEEDLYSEVTAGCLRVLTCNQLCGTHVCKVSAEQAPQICHRFLSCNQQVMTQVNG